MEAAFSQFVPRSKTDNPRSLQEEIYRANIVYQQPLQQQAFMQPQYASSHILPHQMISEEEEFDHMIHHGINNILETHSSHSVEHKPMVSTHPSSQAST